MMSNAWLIPLFPLLGFLLLLAFGRQLKEASAYVGILAALAGFVLALGVFFGRFAAGAEDYVFAFHWLTFGDKGVQMGFVVNQLNAMMLVIVTFVSLLVHIYSKGYMQGDERFPVYYSYLALFTFSMLGLVISPNLLQVFIFWELVGVCSFLLVGFYFEKPEARAAAKKAFIVTRIGDIGLFIATALVFWFVGSFEFSEIFAAAKNGTMESWQITLIGILVFIGAVGKSGQFPLHTWLPDAMEGPTPVSALIHAATMVAAGVYLVATMFPLYEASVTASLVVAYIGGITAIFAASIGITQRDIKRVLAYSTVSQLGFMMLALGMASVAGYVAGTFHLMTHAFFKALLFLGAGSVIHAAHTQDIFEMGGLFKKMRVTGTVFLIGCLAIAGVPPFSGYFSKEEIIGAVYSQGHIGLFVVAIVAAFFTAFYMFRLFFVTFTGKPLSEEARQAEESPLVMTVPMILLAILAISAGWINLPGSQALGNWMTDGAVGAAGQHAPGWVAILATAISLFGILLAYLMYGKKSISNEKAASAFGGLYNLSFKKYFIDEIYDVVFVRSLRAIGRFLTVVDVYIIDGFVRLVGAFTRELGHAGQRVQNGQVQTYGAVALLGIVLLVIGLTFVRGF
ncbi:NADH-quinone oxidoreductase subunit L [Ammoniphilus oxalaticus]|uniref:NADH-quinone oxidoreductase subunit L n=1 Tax=Ammoniphilus oxalaticus TaxID=66863 RepID=A0A419SH16_9BACL|nr:NADH-quinone oxidoreductase subunit L [Ammoniphilus oxalaticus]RKD23079.1 NADH-quinone oxidoreductase subunit L [Ammoniphilus oxalaticus]